MGSPTLGLEVLVRIYLTHLNKIKLSYNGSKRAARNLDG